MTNQDTPMRLARAAEYLGVSESALRRWAIKGEVPCKRIKHKKKSTWLFSREALDEWVAGRG